MMKYGIYAFIVLSILLIDFGLGHRIGFKNGSNAISAKYEGQAEADRNAAELKLQTQTMEDQKAYKDLQDRDASNRALVAASMAENQALSKKLYAAETSLDKLKKADPHVAATLDAPYPDSVKQLRDPITP